MRARFVHTNIVAQNRQRLARFYDQVLGWAPVLPERYLAGDWLEAATGVPDARIQGIHLRLPGFGDHGPTLVVLHHNHQEERPVTAADRPGFADIACAVDDVQAAINAVRKPGWPARCCKRWA
jgi:predicted enzyme related to lactoylglutathione lyase